MNKIILGDCLEKLKELEDNSVDSIVTDPPYELGFMGKSWDNTGIANNVELWKECLRVLKPGGHLLSFGGTRTYHRMASAIEDAGFEVRDMIEWVYSTGFPKSLNIGKAINKIDGIEFDSIPASGVGFMNNDTEDGYHPTINKLVQKGESSERAKQWEGWGTALKPAHEPICMARKPLSEKSVAENCIKWGTGGINIDESRVGTEVITQRLATVEGGKAIGGKGVGIKQKATGETTQTIGRFPANLIHDGSDEVKECFPETKSSKGSFKAEDYEERETATNFTRGDFKGRGDSGNASRFFKSIIYQAKASKSERNKGCEELEEKEEVYPGINTFDENGNRLRNDGSIIPPLKSKNNHPTVKPIALMTYLIKMVTPKGGVVLDPFAGSGSTLVSAKQNGYQYIGIEMTEEYIPIIEARLEA